MEHLPSKIQRPRCTRCNCMFTVYDPLSKTVRKKGEGVYVILKGNCVAVATKNHIRNKREKKKKHNPEEKESKRAVGGVRGVGMRKKLAITSQEL